MSGQGEFEFIARRLAPLSIGGAGSAGLTDDGALLDLSPGETLAVSADTLIQGRHFHMEEDPGLVARKALRVNLSDLAAMGARPFAYMLNIVWPGEGAAGRAERFCAGLARDQAEFGVRLIGGDTTRAEAPWTIAVTAFGRRPAGLSLRRAGARAGDALVVTGTIGDAGLGLMILEGRYTPEDVARRALLERHQLPSPRLAALPALRRHARAAIDISDGLLADCGHLAKASDLTVALDLGAAPLSPAASAWLRDQADAAAGLMQLASSGDDYELALATGSPEALICALGEAGIAARAVGQFEERGPESLRIEREGRVIRPERLGFTHF